MSELITVMGALGNVGNPLVECLLNRKMLVRATHYNPKRVTKRFGNKVEAILFDCTDTSTMAATLMGTDRLFLIRPLHSTDVEKCIYLSPI
ncbi:MAG: NAD(P)H-binding protein [Candidatus Marinimicrobia bacterium]|nr:NAD(P)H-binding protein [Candidatus Neomarinimicrobiota bacterium]